MKHLQGAIYILNLNDVQAKCEEKEIARLYMGAFMLLRSIPKALLANLDLNIIIFSSMLEAKICLSNIKGGTGDCLTGLDWNGVVGRDLVRLGWKPSNEVAARSVFPQKLVPRTRLLSTFLFKAYKLYGAIFCHQLAI